MPNRNVRIIRVSYEADDDMHDSVLTRIKDFVNSLEMQNQITRALTTTENVGIHKVGTVIIGGKED